MSINPLANRPRADACGFGNGLRRLSARDLPYNALSTARRQPGILMHVHPVLPWNPKLQQLQLPRSEPDGQPTESSHLARVSRDRLLPDLYRVAGSFGYKNRQQCLPLKIAPQAVSVRIIIDNLWQSKLFQFGLFVQPGKPPLWLCSTCLPM